VIQTPTIFDRLVLKAAEQIPRGKITTFGEVAKALGDIRAARAVSISVLRDVKSRGGPWHRFVASDGSLGTMAGKKRELLLSEGIPIINSRIRDLERFLVKADEIDVPPILLKMRLAQKKLRERVVLEDRLEEVDLAAGVDVAYGLYRGLEVGYAACVVVDSKLDRVGFKTVRMETTFPYVPTYLAFREMPFIAASTKGIQFDLLLLDGHGIAHPERVGEACHAGLVLGKPSIGVAKSILVGKVVDSVIMHKGENIGYLVGKEGQSPAFVSPGHLVSLETSRSIVEKFWGSYKQPKPLVLAHEIAKKLKRGDVSPTIDLLHEGG